VCRFGRKAGGFSRNAERHKQGIWCRWGQKKNNKPHSGGAGRAGANLPGATPACFPTLTSLCAAAAPREGLARGHLCTADNTCRYEDVYGGLDCGSLSSLAGILLVALHCCSATALRITAHARTRGLRGSGAKHAFLLLAAALQPQHGWHAGSHGGANTGYLWREGWRWRRAASHKYTQASPGFHADNGNLNSDAVHRIPLS